MTGNELYVIVMGMLTLVAFALLVGYVSVRLAVRLGWMADADPHGRLKLLLAIFFLMLALGNTFGWYIGLITPDRLWTAGCALIAGIGFFSMWWERKPPTPNATQKAPKIRLRKPAWGRPK